MHLVPFIFLSGYFPPSTQFSGPAPRAAGSGGQTGILTSYQHTGKQC